MADYPFGYAPGLTPDQQALINQQGYYPQPTMSLPTGQSVQQPQGYSGLTPAQAQTQQALGYYTQDPNQQQPQSLWDKLKAGLGSPDLQKALGQIGGAVTPQRSPLTMPTFTGGGFWNPYMQQLLRSRAPLDPKAALQVIMRGY